MLSFVCFLSVQKRSKCCLCSRLPSDGFANHAVGGMTRWNDSVEFMLAAVVLMSELRWIEVVFLKVTVLVKKFIKKKLY